MGTYFNVTVSGNGVSGNTLLRTGTVTFAISTSLEWATITPYIYALNSSYGDINSGVINPSNIGGNWSSGQEFYIANNSPKTITIDMGSLVSGLSNSNDLAYIAVEVWCGAASGGLVPEEYFTFPVVAGYTVCKGPEWCRLESNYSAGEGVKLSWGAGVAGNNNPIARYNVYRIEMDENWTPENQTNPVSGFEFVTSTPANQMETTVYPPEEAGHYYGYIIETAGQNYTEQSEYSGCRSESLLRKVGICSAPSWCRLSATESKGEAVTLSWGAGSSGSYNNLVGYSVWRALCDPDNQILTGDFEYIGETTTQDRSVTVYPPNQVGEYYVFSVVSVGDVYTNPYSSYTFSESVLRRTRESFGPWTDPVLTARSSYIRAVYITELQERTNLLRGYHGLNSYRFTTITAGVTKISKWATLIQEIRTAIDGITTNHESWNTLEAGKPRIAHITQLRNIIDKL